MIKKLFFSGIFSLSLLVFSCTAQQTSTSNNSNNNGSSFDTAIVIKAANESTGVGKEYEWLKANYPGYKMISQSLSQNSGKPYDIIKIKTADNTSKTIYFDISNFFGKF